MGDRARSLHEGEQQLYVTAGHLQTRYGTPLFLVFQRTDEPGRSPWRLVATGSQVSAPELPAPPGIPAAPDLDRGAEIVMSHDHILGDHDGRVAFLRDTPTGRTDVRSRRRDPMVTQPWPSITALVLRPDELHSPALPASRENITRKVE